MSAFDNNKFRGDGDSLRLNNLGASATRAQFTVSGITSASNLNGTSWTFSTARNDYYVWYNITDHGAGPQDPARSGTGTTPRVGIPVSLTAAVAVDGSATMAATLLQLRKLSEISVSQTASALTVTERAFDGPVTAASAGASGVAVGGAVVGISQSSVVAKFIIMASAGTAEAIIGEDGVVYDLSGSTYRIDDINKEFPSRSGSSGTIVAAAGDTPVKADNLVLANTGSGHLPDFAEASLISGVS